MVGHIAKPIIEDVCMLVPAGLRHYHDVCFTLIHSPEPQTAPVVKTHLLSTTGQDPHGFVVRKVPSTYHCLNNGLFFVCILIADEDLTLATLTEQSIAGNCRTLRCSDCRGHSTEVIVHVTDSIHI